MLDQDSFIKDIYARYSGNIKYGLERMFSILSEMGNPEQKIRGIHIAGTNGKGSTSAMTEAISLQHGRSTGLNTSPHLIDYRERFRINGEEISWQEILSTHDEFRECFELNDASFFEITTAIAFICFHRLKLHTCVFEVGLGGRLDGTNPFNSTVSIITSVALDHLKTLGNTIEKIAFEKGGIIKESVPVVTGKIEPSPLKVIEEIAAKKNAPLYSYGRDFLPVNIRLENGKTTFDLHLFNKDIPLPATINNLSTNLLGIHQAVNASLSTVAYSLYCQRIKEELHLPSLLHGLNSVNWMGRMQVIGDKPLTVVDCAHNEEGITTLVDNLQALFQGKRLHIVLAILRDKDFGKMITLLCNIAYKVYISKNSSERAADHEEQIAIARGCGIPYCADLSVVDAYKRARREADPLDVVIVTGSIYTVSEVIALHKKREK